MFELFFDGQTIVSRDFRVSELHKGGKEIVFKTSAQEMGYTQELAHFLAAVRGNEVVTPNLLAQFDTMDVIFSIERALATATTQTLLPPAHHS